MEIFSFLIILGLIWLAWLFFPFHNMSHKEQLEDDIQHSEKEEQHRVPPVLYQLNTDMIRYKLYSVNHLSKEAQILYTKVIIENLWVNEPFHSTFFKLLLLLNENRFFIQDPFSNVIKCNLRDEYNQMIVVESYTVLSTLEMVEYCIHENFRSIFRHKKQNPKNVILAWILWIMKKSLNMYEDDLLYLKKNVLEDYAQVDHIVSLIEMYDSRFDFIRLTYNFAINFVDRHPYVADGTPSKPSTTVIKLPIKTLQTLPKSVL